MMDHAKILANICASAYRAMVMGQGNVAAAYAAFDQQAKSPEFLAEARRVVAQSEGVQDERCFATLKQRQFLQDAIARADSNAQSD